MQIKIRGFIMGKKGELYTDCRDNYAWSRYHHRFAIADGVSKSFFPGIWSELLVNHYVEDSATFDSVISKGQQEWMSQVTDIVDKPGVKYYTRNAFNRKAPGLATFVGLVFQEQEKKWHSIALGDTYLFFVPRNFSNFKKQRIVHSSKDDQDVFDNFPDYLSSIGDQHKGERKEIGGDIIEGTFYLMTDALAEWFMKQEESAIGKIAAWNSQLHFERYIENLRNEEEINNDDTTVLIIELNDDGKDTFSYEELVVSSLKDLIAGQEKEIAEKVQEAAEVNAQETVIPESTEQKEPNEPGSQTNVDVEPGDEADKK